MSVRFCVDCVYYQREGWFKDKCHAESNLHLVRKHSVVDAYELRKSEQHCGREGRWFKPPVTRWQRVRVLLRKVF